MIAHRQTSTRLARGLAPALLAAALACSHGQFVGSDFLPRNGYAGEPIPSSRLATVTPGWPVGEDGAARLVGVDDLRCEEDMGACTMVTRVPAGPHAFHLRVKSATDWIRYPGGSAPVVTVETEVDLEAGAVYAAVPVAAADGTMGGRVERLCLSADPVATVKAYQLRQDWEATCRQAPAAKAPAKP